MLAFKESMSKHTQHHDMNVGFPCSSSGKESTCSVGDLNWVGKIPWRGERLPTPVFQPREFHGLYSPWGRKELGMTG